MRLLFVANSRIPTERAMGTAIMKQCEAFARRGIDVELVVPRRENTVRDDPFVYHHVEKKFTITYLRSFDVPVLDLVHLRFFVQKLSFFVRLFFYVRQSDADIVYSREPELVGMLLTNKDIVVEVHHMYGLSMFGRFLLSRCTGIIAITRALRDDIVKAFYVPYTKMHVAPSGVDSTLFKESAGKEEAKRALGIATTKPVVLYTGSLETWKGYETFLHASLMLKEEVQCVIIGGNEAQVARLRPAYPDVIFLGFLPQQIIFRNQKAADVLVVPNTGKELISARHTSPLKVFEYMASGVPIVASRTDAISEILSAKNAILVDPDSPEALARGILHAIENTAHSDTIAQQARKDVLHYDWSVRTESIVNFLNESRRMVNS